MAKNTSDLNLISYFFYIFTSLLKGIRNRTKAFCFGIYNPKWYPKEIRNIHKYIAKDYVIEDKLVSYAHLKKFKLTSNDKYDSSINISGFDLNFQQLPKIWDGSFSNSYLDTELINASHRFHWIFELLERNQNSQQLNEIFSLIKDWQISESVEGKGAAYFPYNISERVVNLSTFYSILINNKLIDHSDIKEIKDFINGELTILIDKLEYPVSKIINNHILNNARALYVGGNFLGRNDLMSFAEKIFYLHLPKMVDTDGFLKEASSHYQLLLTRTLVEVSNIASFYGEDPEFIEFIQNASNKMLKASISIAPQNLKDLSEYPAIGDISPDIKFTWFNPIQTQDKGWNKFWEMPSRASDASMNQTFFKSWQLLNKDSWFLVNFFDSSTKQFPFGHGHDDFGSFVLFHDGNQILTDIGRFSYDNIETEKVLGHEKEAHSVLISDEDFIPQYKVNLPFNSNSLSNYFTDRFFSKHSDHSVWITKSKGYLWKRECIIQSRENFQINDHIEKSGGACYFYLYNKVKVNKLSINTIEIIVQDSRYLISFENVKNLRVEEIFCYPNYGEKKLTNRIVWSIQDNNKTAKINFEIIK